MLDWNVVITTHEGRFRQARSVLAPLGPVSPTGFYNVLAMQVAEPERFCERLLAHLQSHPEALTALARVMPVTERFAFQTPQAFEERAIAAAAKWASRLAGKRFHVRMHRRGFKGRLSSQEEERFLDRYLLRAVAAHGGEATIEFTDPDLILCVETLGQQAGLSLWDREALDACPLLHLD